jgi:ribulose-5-phosphate 4-epimerase/fuculose-1-phosphate aldolase
MSATEELEEELKIASKILEWEIGDIWGHVGVRLPEKNTIAVKLFRPPEEGDAKDWVVEFDFSLKKVSGVGSIPREAAIYTEIFKARPDVHAAVHSHAPMSIALSLADKKVACVSMQSNRFGRGAPIYPKPIFIMDEAEGADLARSLSDAVAVTIKGHGIVTVGKSIDDACMNALYMERAAKIQAVANLLGFSGPTEEFLNEMNSSRQKLFSQFGARERRPAHSPEWNYYSEKLKKGEPWSRGWT